MEEPNLPSFDECDMFDTDLNFGMTMYGTQQEYLFLNTNGRVNLELPVTLPSIEGMEPILPSFDDCDMFDTVPFGMDPEDLLINTSEIAIMESPITLPSIEATTSAAPGKNSACSDEEATDISDSGNKKQKAKKRKKALRDPAAPRLPFTGYVRFLNDRRDKVRADNPSLPIFEVTKIMAAEWSQMTPDQKKPYLDAGDLDRKRYARELDTYKRTDAYQIFTGKQKEKKICLEEPELKLPAPDDICPDGHPMTTGELLDHNQNEIRQLRKSSIDLEKRKKGLRDPAAPRLPLTGYVRFLNDRRDKVRADNPSLPIFEVTKIMAAEWSQLTPDQKKPYLDAGDVDKDRYTAELNAYKQTDAYKTFTDKQKEKKICLEEPELRLPAPDDCSAKLDAQFPLPVFTGELLDHNKTLLDDICKLKKSNIDLEKQNSALKTHIQEIKTVFDCLVAETKPAQANNSALRKHLNQLQTVLTKNLGSVHVPDYPPPSLDNMDGFMTQLTQMLQDPTTPNREELANKVRDLKGCLEFCG